MSKRQLLILLGVWIAIFLFLGFPSYLDKIFALISGVLILIIAITLKPNHRIVNKDAVPFVEHKSTSPIQVTDIPKGIDDRTNMSPDSTLPTS